MKGQHGDTYHYGVEGPLSTTPSLPLLDTMPTKHIPSATHTVQKGYSMPWIPAPPLSTKHTDHQ